MSDTTIIALLATLDARTLVSMFWFLILFEGPRFAIANIVAAVELLSRRKPLARGPVPSVSVIVPSHNGAAGTSRTLASLREQTLQHIQVIVVDDGSSDRIEVAAHNPTNRDAQSSKGKDCRDVVVLSTRFRGGKSAALNLGLCYCEHPVVVCVDSDTTFDRDGLRQIAMQFEDPAVGAAGGNIGIRNQSSSLLATMQAVEYTIGISMGRRIGMMLGILPIASGAFAAFRLDALRSVGGWEAGPGEDADLTLKLKHAGWSINFVSRACALTDAPTTLPGLVAQRLRWESDLVHLQAEKFRTLLSPRSPRFSLRNALGSIDVLMFSFGMSFVFLGYVVWLMSIYGERSLSILFAGTIVYSIIGTVNFALGAALSASPNRARLLPYAFGYGVYALFILQPIRLWACIDELVFKRSLRPGFVPAKVINQIGSV